jgi:LacI family transcriptional regulator, galactose operon repressor
MSPVVKPVPKIKDVARAAGVSPATVSRVLNGNDAVAPERAARVLQVAAELGYQPHGPARALRQQRTRLWAVIVSDIQNPFFTTMVRGIEDVGRAEGHRIVLCNSDEDPTREAAYIDVAVAERMGGVVIAPASDRSSRVDTLLERRIPVVTVDRRLRHGHDHVDSVMVDNRAGAIAATDHLLTNGAKRIACITGPARASTAAERLTGYRTALRKAGREPRPDLIRHADFRHEGGYTATTDLLRTRHRPDALFVTNNLMTLGALQAIADTGLQVPHDIAIVGFDDAPWATLTTPPLTVIAQPTLEIGREAGRLLATAANATTTRHIVLSPTLIIRQSSEPPT